MDTVTPQRSVELLHAAAIRAGLLGVDDPAPADGVVSDAAAEAIEALIDRIAEPEPADDESCRRWYEAHAASLARGEQVHARHVLFAVTPGIDVDALREKAESCLLDLRARGRDDEVEHERFASAARQWSNCPSAAQGGDLGWLAASDCAPEFAREVFGQTEVGVLPRLVATRFGFHVVEVLERVPGEVPPFESVREAVRTRLAQQAWANRVRGYVQQLADGEP